MLITGIEADDLLSFDSLAVDFGPGLNVVVGQNDVGKSNLIRLVKLVRDLVTSLPLGEPPVYGFEQRFVRLDGPGRGRLRLGVRFTEPDERALLLLFARALAAQSAEAIGSPPTISAGSLLARYQRTANHMERCLSEADVSSLFEGKIVLELDARQPPRWALGYEFQHRGQTLHLGLHGPAVGTGVLGHGHVNIDDPTWSTTPLNLAEKVNPDSTDWDLISFEDLLPPEDQACFWEFAPGQNNVRRPLTLQLARELSLAADNTKMPSFLWVIRKIISRRVLTTENLRRPPRQVYELDEATPRLAVEDAGDLPLVLYLSKNGAPDDRARYLDLQERFRAMTGRRFDLAAAVAAAPSGQPALDLELQVESRAGWVPIEHAGSGLWEALIALNAAVPVPGDVALLDEPATHLHSSWQRQLLRYLREHHQVVMVTHSPFLVPAVTSNDFARVTRLAVSDGQVVAVSIGQDLPPREWQDRWRQIFAGSTDARDVLFSRGVILVEGDTEVGAFRHWFNDPTIVGGLERGAEARNVSIVSVDGDQNFGVWVSYLQQMSVPWVILADGPVLSPRYTRSLTEQLGQDPTTGRRVTDLVGEPPNPDDFQQSIAYWRANGVLTVATTFGLKPNGTKMSSGSAESGEIENWFADLDGDLWSATKAVATSKVRRGYRFAEDLDLKDQGHALEMLCQLWEALALRVDPGHPSPAH